MSDEQQQAATWEEFERVALRVGTIIEARPLEKARIPAYKLAIDFGPHGIKQSSAQLTALYTPEDLLRRQVICVTGFEPKRVAGFKSEVLVTGIVLEGGEVVLAAIDRPVPNGSPLA